MDPKTKMYLDSAQEATMSVIDILNDLIDHTVDIGGEQSAFICRVQDARDLARQLYDEVSDV